MNKLFCPTLDQLTDLSLSLLPRGAAWPRTQGTVIYAYWRAVAQSVYYFHARLCALFSEFFCTSARETRDWWLIEFGLPSQCDPFADPCIKETAVIEPVCASYESVAARAGWLIQCLPRWNGEAGCIEAGLPGGFVSPRTLIFNVYLGRSPAYAGATFGPVAGCFEAGSPVLCEHDISALDCLLQRVVQADVEIKYALIT